MTDQPNITKFEDLFTEILVEIFSDFLKVWTEVKSLSIDKETRKNYDFLRNCQEVCHTCFSFSTLTKHLITLRMMKSSHHWSYEYQNEKMKHWTSSTKIRDDCKIQTSSNSRDCFQHDANSLSHWTLHIVVIWFYRVRDASSRCRLWSSDNHRTSVEKKSECWDY